MNERSFVGKLFLKFFAIIAGGVFLWVFMDILLKASALNMNYWAIATTCIGALLAISFFGYFTQMIEDGNGVFLGGLGASFLIIIWGLFLLWYPDHKQLLNLLYLLKVF